MTERTMTDLTGVYASGTNCGIKAGKKDLSYIYIPQAYASAGVFTRNKFRAPCVDYTEALVNSGKCKAVITNSGNANAATGEQGFANARKTSELAATLLHLQPDEVAVASTGIIGVQLPMEKIEKGLAALLQQPEKKEGLIAAQAIMTTDTFPKQVFVEKEVDGKKLVIAGMAKGSGMIAPNMATMLGYLVTNAKLEHEKLRPALRSAVDKSFNMVSVDTDTSTNDLVLLFSTGEVAISATEYSLFSTLLEEACVELAKMIARDGEGAEKLIEAVVSGASDDEQARRIARNIIESPLIKTAVHGADPNWGRVIMAVGKDPSLEVQPKLIDLYFGTEQILSKGQILDYNKNDVRIVLSAKEVQIRVDLNIGRGKATAWGCDLTKGYIDINTEYS